MSKQGSLSAETNSLSCSSSIGILRPRAGTRVGLRSLIRAVRHKFHTAGTAPEGFERLPGIELDQWDQSKNHIFVVDSREAARCLSFQLYRRLSKCRVRRKRFLVAEVSYKWRSAREWMTIHSNLRLIYTTHNYNVGYSCPLETCVQKALHSANLTTEVLQHNLGQLDPQHFKQLSMWMGIYSDWDLLILDIDEIDVDSLKHTIETILRIAAGRKISVITRNGSFAYELQTELGEFEVHSYELNSSSEAGSATSEGDPSDTFDDDLDTTVSGDSLPAAYSPTTIFPRTFLVSPVIVVDQLKLNGNALSLLNNAEKPSIPTVVLREGERFNFECQIRIKDWDSNLSVGLVLREPQADAIFMVESSSVEQLASSEATISATLIAPQAPNQTLGIGLALCSKELPSDYFSLKKLLVVSTKSTDMSRTLSSRIEDFRVSRAV